VRGHRLTRAARQHDAGDGVIEVEILARDPVDVRDREPARCAPDPHRRAQPYSASASDHTAASSAMFLRWNCAAAALLQLGRRDELRRDAFTRDAR